jgi:hypothetical protein
VISLEPKRLRADFPEHRRAGKEEPEAQAAFAGQELMRVGIPGHQQGLRKNSAAPVIPLEQKLFWAEIPEHRREGRAEPRAWRNRVQAKIAEYPQDGAERADQ